jgi:uncharacterized protein (TIGR02246 family)
MRYLLPLSVAAMASACATSLGGGAGASEQVAAATLAWRVAYDSREPSRITALYDSDAVLWGTAAKTVAPNPAAIAEYFKNAAARPDARVSFGEQNIRVYGDVAVNTGYYTFSDVRDGQRTERPARYTLVFRNREGRWLIVGHHSSLVP